MSRIKPGSESPDIPQLKEATDKALETDEESENDEQDEEREIDDIRDNLEDKDRDTIIREEDDREKIIIYNI